MRTRMFEANKGREQGALGGLVSSLFPVTKHRIRFGVGAGGVVGSLLGGAWVRIPRRFGLTPRNLSTRRSLLALFRFLGLFIRQG